MGSKGGVNQNNFIVRKVNRLTTHITSVLIITYLNILFLIIFDMIDLYLNSITNNNEVNFVTKSFFSFQ